MRHCVLSILSGANRRFMDSPPTHAGLPAMHRGDILSFNQIGARLGDKIIVCNSGSDKDSTQPALIELFYSDHMQ